MFKDRNDKLKALFMSYEKQSRHSNPNASATSGDAGTSSNTNTRPNTSNPNPSPNQNPNSNGAELPESGESSLQSKLKSLFGSGGGSGGGGGGGGGGGEDEEDGELYDEVEKRKTLVDHCDEERDAQVRAFCAIFYFLLKVAEAC